MLRLKILNLIPHYFVGSILSCMLSRSLPSDRPLLFAVNPQLSSGTNHAGNTAARYPSTVKLLMVSPLDSLRHAMKITAFSLYTLDYSDNYPT